MTAVQKETWMAEPDLNKSCQERSVWMDQFVYKKGVAVKVPSSVKGTHYRVYLPHRGKPICYCRWAETHPSWRCGCKNRQSHKGWATLLQARTSSPERV